MDGSALGSGLLDRHLLAAFVHGRGSLDALPWDMLRIPHVAAILLPACAPPPEPGPPADAMACNGHAALCERPLDEVALPGTHNSAASEADGFARGLNANQAVGIGAQLDAGVRVFLLDLYEQGGERVLCHGPCSLGQVPHLDVLAMFGTFIQTYPRDTIVLIYEDHVPAEAIEADLAEAGLAERAYTHPDGAPWPTLGELAEARTTLVVSAESAGPPPDWLHHIWDLAWDTPYRWTDPADFDCSLNRGDPTHDLLLVNHWLSTELGLPDPERATEANAYESLLAHAGGCKKHPAAFPNFVVVDYFDTGDLFEVVQELNGL